MPTVVDAATGEEAFVANENLEQALASGKYQLPEGAEVRVTSPEGRLLSATPEQLAAARQVGSGVAPSTEGQIRAADEKARIERQHGGGLGALAAGAESAADAATLGGYGAFTRRILPDSYTENRRERHEANPIPSAIGTGLGIAVPAVLSGGAGGIGAAARVLPAGALARATGSSIGGMIVEGAVQGAAGEAAQVFLSEDPVTVERLAGALGSGALLGGAAGGAVGIFAKGAEKALARGGKFLDDAVTKARAASPKGNEAIVEQFGAYRAATAGDGSPWLIAETADARSTLRGTQAAFKRGLSDTVGLTENPARLLKPLRQEAQAIRAELAAADEGLSAKLLKEHTDIAADLGTQIAKGDAEPILLTGKAKQRYTDWSGVKGPKAGIAVDAAQAGAFKAALEAGEVQGKRAAALASMPRVLEQNEALQAAITAATEPAEKGLLGRFAAKAADKAAVGLGMSMVTGLVGGGPLGAVGAMVLPDAIKAAGALMTGRLGKAATESTLRTAKAVSGFLDAAAKVTPTVAAAMTPLAGRALASASFGPPVKDERPDYITRKETPLVASFRARERELRAQVLPGLDGQLKTTPAARQRIAQSLAAVHAASPTLADQIETVVSRKLEFLSTKLPKRPDFLATHVGPETWQPTDMDMRSFGRYVAAVEDPGAVEERLMAGIVTPEDAEAFRVVYPERFQALKQDIVAKLPELRASLPYARQVALSVFTGVPVDPAMRPEVLARLQGSYAGEQGSQGGSMAPRAMPQSGSVKSMDLEPATPAQERSR